MVLSVRCVVPRPQGIIMVRTRAQDVGSVATKRENDFKQSSFSS